MQNKLYKKAIIAIFFFNLKSATFVAKILQIIIFIVKIYANESLHIAF